MLLIIAVGIALRMPLLLGGELDFDEGVYWQSLRALYAGHSLFTETYSSQPPAFLLSLQPFFAIGHSLVAARTGVLVISLLGIVGMFQLVRVLAGWAAGLAAAALLALDPLALRESVTLQADSPSVALGTVAMALAATAGVRRTRAASICRVLAGAVLGLAVCTKFLAFAFIPPIFLLLSMPAEDTGAASRGTPAARLSSVVTAARLPVLQLSVGLLVSLAAILAPFAAHWSAMWHQVVSVHLAAHALSIGGAGSGVLRDAPLLALAAIGFGVAVRGDRRNAILLLCWGASVGVVVASLHPLWRHDLVVAIPLLAAAAAPVVVSIARRGPAARLALGAAAIVAVASVFAVGKTTLTAVPRADEVLESSTSPTQLVISDDPFAVADANRSIPPGLIETSRVGIETHDVTLRDIQAAVARDRVRVVYLTENLYSMPGLRAWVAQQFPQQRTLAPGAVVFSR